MGKLLKTSVGDNSNPILYQYITTYIFKELIKKQLPAPPVPSLPDSSNKQHSLTYEEKNALCYAAGYIPRALCKRLQHSTHKLKEDLIICLHELTECDGIDSESQDFIKKIDQGGLQHVNFAMYSLILAMELKLQTFLQQVTYHPVAIKENAIDMIMSCDEVKYCWDTLSANWEVEERKALLPMITELWVTMREFAYVNAWIEQYK